VVDEASSPVGAIRMDSIASLLAQDRKPTHA
jgi:hypothetical protein